MDWYLLGLVVGLGYHCYTDVSYLLLYDSTNILLALLGLGRAWHLGLMSEAWQGAVALGIMMLIIYCVSHMCLFIGQIYVYNTTLNVFMIIVCVVNISSYISYNSY